MINKISNLKLILGLVLLGLIYLTVVYFDSPRSAELEKDLVSIDTSNVTGLTIESIEETVRLYREDNSWQVALATGKRVTAEADKVNALIRQLINLKPDRLAAKDQSKWADYQVDSTGTRIQVQEGAESTLDMIIGQSGSTAYLRLGGETEVYASDGFTGLGKNDQINNYRDNTFISMKTDSITSITFDYPGDSSFQLVNNGNIWNFEDGTAVDSTKSANYLGQLGSKNSDNFALQDGSSLGPQVAEISISSLNQQQISITAYGDPSDSVIFQSSLNQEAYFNDKDLGKDFFLGKEYFE